MITSAKHRHDLQIQAGVEENNLQTSQKNDCCYFVQLMSIKHGQFLSNASKVANKGNISYQPEHFW